ncbi:MAG: diacylglycerol kinase family protein [Actinomycetota bacterium]|nr:diacylglycerol kinase family protein [Actinomycetota bacterium]
MKNPERRGFLESIKSIEERLLLIVNPMSKKGAEIASRIRSMIRREGVNLEETSTDHPDDAGSTLEFWSKRFGGSRVIMVFGGDGAINQVINNVMLSHSNKNVVLVPFPCGTANDFCRAMGLDSVEKTLEAMAAFKVKPIDLIKLEMVDRNGKQTVRYCSNIIGLGLDGDLAKRALGYKRYGVAGYWYSSIKRAIQLIFKEPETYLLRIKTPSLEQYGHFFDVLLSKIDRYGQNLHVAPGAKLDDGKIYITIGKPMSTIKAFLTVMLLLKGLHTKMPGIEFFVTESAEIEILDDVYAQEDGEVRFYPHETKIYLSVERKALEVLSPAESS